jgi:hypothetical protein
MQKYKSALADSTNRFHTTERKIKEIEKTRWTTEP